MSDSKKVNLEGDSKEPTDKDEIKDSELEEVVGGAAVDYQPAAPTADPPGVVVGRFSNISGKY